jgi:hypothetical protein
MSIRTADVGSEDFEVTFSGFGIIKHVTGQRRMDDGQRYGCSQGVNNLTLAPFIVLTTISSDLSLQKHDTIRFDNGAPNTTLSKFLILF